MADFSPAFAHLYANKRMPTAGEVDNGFGCGPADLDLFNGLWNTIYLELGALITLTGGTPTNANMQQLAEAVQSGGLNWAVATGSANAWTVAPALAVPAYAAGRVLWIKAPATNTSTTVNANVSTLGNRRVKKADGTDPAVGDIVIGRWYPTIDDGTNVCIVSTLPSDVNVAVAANKSPFNLATVSDSTRVAYAGIVGYQSVMSGTYTKKSATSTVNVRVVTNLLSTATYGAGLLRMVFDGVTHPEFVAVNMTPTANQTSPHGVATFTGRPAGARAWNFYIGRPDANAWTSVFNPDTTNSGNLPATTRTTLSFEEVEP